MLWYFFFSDKKYLLVRKKGNLIFSGLISWIFHKDVKCINTLLILWEKCVYIFFHFNKVYVDIPIL